MNRAKTLHISGTGSGVGKSVIVSALCRIFLQDGYKVCPFKAQNMSLNSFVTKDGGEIGRAQAFQAEACGIEPAVDMNPILIKPTGDKHAQVIVHGKPVANMSALAYVRNKKRLSKSALESFDRLKDKYELMVLEGAGSPAEINLKSHDIVNLKMARYAAAPVILVGDIDKGGVFAWLVGTLELLEKEERKQIKAFIINKFRGDVKLLKSGIDFLEKRTGIKVLGVIPYFHPSGRNGIKISEEDSVSLGNFDANVTNGRRKLNIDVIYLPHISNFTDFDALEKEPDVRLRYIKDLDSLDKPDVIIIPGTKNTAGDLRYLKESGFAKKMQVIMEDNRSAVLIGICGGFQMLGTKIRDPYKAESRQGDVDGLGILKMETVFGKDKVLSQVKAVEARSGLVVSGYEIHHGKPRNIKKYAPAFNIIEREGERVRRAEGVVALNGRIYGTYIHGIFDADIFRRKFLNRIRSKKGWGALSRTTIFSPDRELNKLAGLVRKNIDMKYLYKIVESGA
ncbi:MAG: cobyric acid synthase [Candidatus Omnitrophota bacterium]|nr:cobyric acid synthase [Candidatus Omnitrophota bacterium]